MGCHRHRRGFTLIEAMIVVAVVGILAVLAVVAYQRWVKTSFVAEGQDMVTHIRSAEEAFYGENGAYLDVSGNVGDGFSYPLPHPANSKTAWGGPCTGCTSPGTGNWNGLNVTSAAPVIFGYSVVADQAKAPGTRLPGITVNGATLDMTAMGTGAPWYFVEADANISGDKVNYVHVYGMSGTNTLYVDGEGK
jgi:prepilin-type N-terminal cleavage/methylation domain-containing protein